MKITEIHEAKYQSWINRSSSNRSIPFLKTRFKRKPFNWECFKHLRNYEMCVWDILNLRGYNESIPFNDECNRHKLPNMPYHEGHNKLMYKLQIGQHLNDGQNDIKSKELIWTYYFKYKQ
jgi:hypothetical protein